MATPMSASQFVAALKREGVRVSERYSGWRTHNRNHRGSFSNINGVVIHHTAGRNSASLCYNGTSALPGPLCHTHLAKDGTATMMSSGRANHAGSFPANAFNAMLNESKTHPRPSGAETVDANARTYGIEIENLGNGRDYYPTKQYDAAVRWAAAICRHYGWTAQSVIGHKEGTTRKIDPKGPVGSSTGKAFDMNRFRADVQKRLDGPASGGSTTAPKPKPKPVRKLVWQAVGGFMPELRYGDENWHVDFLQRNLNRFLSPNLKVTGVYDDATARAVDKFYAEYLDYDTTTGGRVFSKGGWRRVLSIAATQDGKP